MNEAIFILPKGIFQRNEYLFSSLNLKAIVIVSPPDADTVLMCQMDNWNFKDFSELIEALKLLICRKENLKAEKDRDSPLWSFQSITKNPTTT